MAPFDFQAHDTFFIVGHLHYVLIGGTRLPDRRRPLLLLPARHRQEAVRAARADRVLADVRRLQRHVPADAPHRPARHAAPRLHLSGRPRLRHAEPGLEHRRVHPRAPASLVVRLGCRPAQGASSRTPSAIRGTPARSSGWRRCRASRGACARSRRSTAAIRCGTSRTSCATSTRGASTCPTPRRAGARRSSRRAIDAQPVQCLRLPASTLRHAARRAVHRRRLHLLAPFTGGGRRSSAPCSRSASIVTWLWTGTALIPGEADEGRRPRPHAAALRLGTGVGRLVGDVHHDAGRSDGVRQPRVRLLLLLDGPRRTFRPIRPPGPGVCWPSIALGAARSARGCSRCSRGAGTGATRAAWFYAALAAAAVLAAAGGGGAARRAVAHRTRSRRRTSIAATVWILVIWTAAHVARRHHHAALLRRAPARGPHDRAARHGHRERHALLALRRAHRRRSPSRSSRASRWWHEATADRDRTTPDRDSLWLLTIAPAIWAAHFLLVLRHRRDLVREVRAAGRPARRRPDGDRVVHGGRARRRSRSSAGRASGGISSRHGSHDARPRLRPRTGTASSALRRCCCRG